MKNIKVIDCRHSEAFDAKCNELSDLILQYSENFDLLVGIATGGQFVAAKLLQRIAIQNYMIVKRQRSGTKTKEKSRTLKYIINSIPGPVQNIMRRSEIYIREKLARSRYSENPISNLSIIQSPSKHILESCKSVLIVDDAVDSGNTLSQVKEYVHCIIPLAIIKTAAITSTFEKPVIFPDYVLHRRTIVKNSVVNRCAELILRMADEYETRSQCRNSNLQ